MSHTRPPPPPPLPPLVLEAALVVSVNVLDIHPIVRVVLVFVEYEGDEVALSTIVLHELIDPGTIVNASPLMLYSPPTTETEDGPLIPVMVTAFEICWVDSSVPVRGEKLNTFGVVSAGSANAKRDSWFVVNTQFPHAVIMQLENSA